MVLFSKSSGFVQQKYMVLFNKTAIFGENRLKRASFRGPSSPFLSRCLNNPELNMPKTGSYATKDDLGRKWRILREVNVNIFQHELAPPTVVNLFHWVLKGKINNKFLGNSAICYYLCSAFTQSVACVTQARTNTMIWLTKYIHLKNYYPFY